jgi:hypothetical protein
VIDAAHLLLDGRGDRFLDGDRVGTHVGTLELDLRRRDVREERDGEAAHRHQAQDHHDDRDHHGHDGPTDEEGGHGSS